MIVARLKSASERVRNESIKKQLDIKIVENAVQSAQKVKLNTTCYFMIGLPGETKKEAQETIYYSAKLAIKGLDECVIGIFSLLTGTELFKQLADKNKVKLDDDFFENLLSMGDLKKIKSWTEYITDKELKKIRALGYLSFAAAKIIFYPLKSIKSFFNIILGKYELKSERVAGTFLKRKKQNAKK
ncbi:MAG TPA: hypothetical protein PLM75_00425 [bacterium]|nr:hypothetical protein [bacterium]HPP86311.1 hypothetical protein [bacterium]